jgi:glycolate oxidase FAD binding subunit
MNEPLMPRDQSALAGIVADAATRRSPLAIVGGGTRLGLGRPMQTAATVSTAALTGVTLYEPSELVMSARAGMPLSEIEALLSGHRQGLAFEPPDHRRLHGTAGEATIGAVAATNRSGPRRIQAGAARDSLIGVHAVNGSGEIVRSGGRVMKNVTGYDLVKLLAGSHGTLAVLSEVTFKVAPLPETETTVMIPGLDDIGAVVALSAALGSPFGVTGAAHLPGALPRTCVRVEGFAASVAHRADRLVSLLANHGAAEVLDAAASASLWRAIRDLDALAEPRSRPIWRVSVKPSDGPAVAAATRAAMDADILYDWGGGLVWIAGGGDRPDAGASVIRAAVDKASGHATLVRAPDDVRLAVDVFQPLPESMMELTRKLKAAFDPAGILNPGRMYPGI